VDERHPFYNQKGRRLPQVPPTTSYLQTVLRVQRNYILPFSHTGGARKPQPLAKNPGDLWQKFAGLRALYGYTMAHTGQKAPVMAGSLRNSSN
jgi:1,4-alpha-glucan branching enzyme